MKVCAEYEDQITAFTAHRTLLDNGVRPEDIEIRSPYPLAEHPVPPHHSRPMIMRNVVRLTWLTGLIAGFVFLTITQWEWGLTAKTGGLALVSIPINAIIMYETGMISALLMTTLMFFVETRRFRQLVPALEEDMPVAYGNIVLVVVGEKVEKAKEWLGGTNARSIASYVLPLAFVSFFLSGCSAQFVQTAIPQFDFFRQQQQVIKPGEQAADLPAPFSIRMPSVAEQKVVPLEPLGWMYYGDVIAYERAEVAFKSKEDEMNAAVKAGTMKRKDVNKALLEMRGELNEFMPEILLYKSGVPNEVREAKNPVETTAESLSRGAELYAINCAQCHGDKGLGEGAVGAKWGGPVVVPHIGDAAKYGDKSTYPDGFFYHNIIVGKNLMPAFGYKLTTEEVWDVVNHIRTLQGAR